MKMLQCGVVVSVLAIAGCAGQPPVPPPEYPGLEQSAQVVIRDLRPAYEGEKEIFSLLVTSDAYAIYRMADDATKPVATRLLAHRAFETFPELASQPEIVVRHFVTYANLQSQLRKSSLVAGLTGPIGAALLTPTEFPAGEVKTTRIDSAVFERSAGDEEYTRAFFTEQENPEKSPVNVVYIDTELLGQRIASRCLVPPVASKPYMYLIEAIDMCIVNHLALYRAKPANTAAQ